MSDFVHLHVHSEYSLLDGLARLPDLCSYAKESGMNAIALTDHGQMYGMIKFHHAAKKAGIKPIYGCEIYQAPRSRFRKNPQKDRSAYHLVLLAKNMTGYMNLLQLVTKANLEGFYYRPRIDRELLAEHAEGLICLSACVSGQVPAHIAEGRMDLARETVGWFKEVFGPENYYLELQRHAGVPHQEDVNYKLIALAAEFGLRCVATNDVHYVRRSDAKTQDLLLAMQTQTTLADKDRMRMGSDDYYVMSPEEMAIHMPEFPEALENTVRIAEQCDVDLSFSGYHLPKFDVPEPFVAESYLRKLCEEGLVRRYPQITPEIQARLEHELGVIHTMGFDDYFLINHDLVNWAKHEAGMLIGPGRGSGPSSIVAYALGITELEPLGLGLIFERFLNPGRITMPDIDLDYPEDRRGEVIEYLFQKYGEDRTSQIATFGTMAARGAIRDVGRALGIELDEVDRIAKLVPSGPKKTIQDGLDEVPELKQAYDTLPYVKEWVDYALAVQGLSRHLSTHAAGVLISDRPMVEYSPLQRAPRGEGIISQFCMEDVEAIGLLKLDVLGLSTLTVLDRAFKWIERTKAVKLSQETLPLDDPETYALLSSGEVTGIFQVESSGMRRILRDMQPTEFRDIVAVLALYRPGPMQFIPNYINRKFGREEVTYHHPSLEPILAETYGIIVYQEQIIRIATELAGYSASEADLMRRAVGHKILEVLEQQRGRFVDSAVEHGLPRESAEAIFEDIIFFANYGFNKPHSAAYAVITLQTAYLKAHYPVEFLCALLSVERGNAEKVAMFISEGRRLGLTFKGPDVNASQVDFSIECGDYRTLKEKDALLNAEDLSIRFGLGGIKNVGDGPAQVIVDARGDTPFADVEDFVSRVDLRQVNKRVLECLVRAGALDSLGERSALIESLDQMLSISQETHRAREIGQRSLFDLSPALADAVSGAKFVLPDAISPLPNKKRLEDEKELLGVYMSTHPLDVFTRYLDERLTPAADIEPSMVNQMVQVAGLLSSIRTITTKKGDPMAFAQIEDLSGKAEVVIFPRIFETCRDLLRDDMLIHMQAKVDMRDDSPQLIADTLEAYRLPADAKTRRPAHREAKHLALEIPLDPRDPESAELATKVLSLLTGHEGGVPFSFRLQSPRGQVEIRFPNMSTTFSAQLEQEITSLIGRGHLSVDWG